MKKNTSIEPEDIQLLGIVNLDLVLESFLNVSIQKEMLRLRIWSRELYTQLSGKLHSMPVPLFRRFLFGEGCFLVKESNKLYVKQKLREIQTTRKKTSWAFEYGDQGSVLFRNIDDVLLISRNNLMESRFREICSELKTESAIDNWKVVTDQE